MHIATFQGQGWCPMCPGMDGSMGWVWMLLMGLFWIAVLGGVIWILYRLARSQGWIGAGHRSGRSEEVLRERYARGEIDRETYDAMLEDLARRRTEPGPPS